jgi:tRNA pseudouridine55 synthase
MDFDRGVILNIDKPAGWTSFDVVRRIRSLTKTKKVGHSGTLDPMAVGVLLICTGKATKRVPELLEMEKEYEAEILLGIETDTLDITGETVSISDIPDHLKQQLPAILSQFTGDILQIPPMVSALKKDGRPLYKMARKGIQISLQPRPVRINGIEILGIGNDRFQIRVRCSRGTYIRSLARDIGNQLGTLGTLSSLVRTRIGPYTRKQAWTIPAFQGFVDTLGDSIRLNTSDINTLSENRL